MSGPADWSDRAQSDRPSDQVRAKVVFCKPLTTLSPDQWLLNHQGSVLASYGSPPTANRWPHWGGVLPLCRGAVGVFYSPSRQGGNLGWLRIIIVDHLTRIELTNNGLRGKYSNPFVSVDIAPNFQVGSLSNYLKSLHSVLNVGLSTF